MDWRNPQKQPGLIVIRNRARSISGLARLIGIADHELRATLYGKTRPSAVVRERLPLILGVPLEALFDADVIAEEKRPPGTPPPVRRSPESGVGVSADAKAAAARCGGCSTAAVTGGPGALGGGPAGRSAGSAGVVSTRKGNRPRCTLDGCERPNAARASHPGYCGPHMIAARRDDPTWPRCSAEDACAEPAFVAHRCAAHHHRYNRATSRGTS